MLAFLDVCGENPCANGGTCYPDGFGFRCACRNGWIGKICDGEQVLSWWRHQMETFSALLAFCAGNSPVAGQFPAQRPVTQSFDFFFHLRLIKQLSRLIITPVIWDVIGSIMTSLLLYWIKSLMCRDVSRQCVVLKNIGACLGPLLLTRLNLNAWMEK